MRLGILGATGLVGERFLKELECFESPIQELRLFSRSKKEILFQGQALKTQAPSLEGFQGLDVCFFSAGKSTSLEWAKRVCKQGVIVIDNSSAFRGDPGVLLVVPEVNGSQLSFKPQIISNPNCSTIQLVMALSPLDKAFGVKRVRVVSLQSMSGAGRDSVQKLKEDTKSILKGETSYKTEDLRSGFNMIPYIGSIMNNGFCEEEMKIHNETRRILGIQDLDISAFTIRTPTLNSHSEVCWVELKNPPQERSEIRKVLDQFPGVTVTDQIPHGRQASGEKEVFVGRIHRDLAPSKAWILWIVADNLLKGASLNGLQILKRLIEISNRKASGVLKEYRG